jgi:hypothetical protein
MEAETFSLYKLELTDKTKNVELGNNSAQEEIN